MSNNISGTYLAKVFCSVVGVYGILIFFGWLVSETPEEKKQRREEAIAEVLAEQKKKRAEQDRRDEENRKKRELEDKNCTPRKNETYATWALRQDKTDKGCVPYTFDRWKIRFNRNDESHTSTRVPPPCYPLDKNTCLEGNPKWQDRRLTGIIKNTSPRTLTSIYIEYRCKNKQGIWVGETNDRMWSQLHPGEKWRFSVWCYQSDAWEYHRVGVTSR